VTELEESSLGRAIILPQVVPERSIDDMLNAWIDEKKKNTGSEKTKLAYVATMESFRQTLERYHLDLDGTPRLVAEIAQSWSAKVHEKDTHNLSEVSETTINQRLSVVSSFYRYVLRMYRDDKHGITENPIDRLKRPKVRAYQHTRALATEDVGQILRDIDRKTVEGKLEYALMSIAVNTGRRIAEIAGLRWKHLTVRGEKVTLLFAHAKGGKVMRDELKKNTSAALLDYLHAYYGPDLGHLDHNAAIWITLTPSRYYGKPMSIRSMQRICERLFDANFHELRATFAKTLEVAGAKPSEIQARLGHESLDTTGRYMQAVHSAENPHGDKMETLYGME
jgi:integrase